MVFVREPTVGSKIIFFLARDHFINLVRKPGCIIQGCACGGYIGDRVGVGLINRTRTDHAAP